MRSSGYLAVDKTVFIKKDTSEKYQVFRYYNSESKHSRTVEIQKNDSMIYFKLPNNLDSTIKISFYLKMNEGDTIEIDMLSNNSNLDFYYLFGQNMLFTKHKIRIDSIRNINYSVGKLKTWYLNNESIFVDSIGFIKNQGYIKESSPYSTFLYSCVNDNFISLEDTSIKNISDYCNYDTFFSKIHFDAINNIQSSKYKVFPNPFHDKLVIENVNINDSTTFDVFDVLGNAIPIDECIKTENNSIMLILKPINNGVYTLVISQKHDFYIKVTYVMLLKE